MKDPVFVIHGVGNRDRSAFSATVTRLQAAVDSVSLLPIYWGDLGADETFVRLALPIRSAGLRGGHEPSKDGTEQLLTAMLGEGEQPDGSGLPVVVWDTVRNTWKSRAISDLRDGPTEPSLDLLLAVLTEEWPATTWLSRSTDAGLLGEIGRAIVHATIESDEADVPWDGLRGTTPDRLRSLIRHRLSDFDRIAGAAMQALTGRINHSFRSRVIPGTTRFLGDVLVYQRHKQEIHARIRETIARVDPALGRSPDSPVRIVAHSLGGVIAVDMATAHDPLWTSTLLTFGSQAAYFHLCDPRGGQLAPYTGREPVTLPSTLGSWTNLWQPLDVLAFAASRLFRFVNGTSPLDIPLPHTVSAGLWTHSAYWDMTELASSITAVMNPAAHRWDEESGGTTC